MRIYINQTVKRDPEGLDVEHPDYQDWQEGIVDVFMVVTDAICLETGRKGQDALYGISVSDKDDSYLRTIKADQIKTVLSEIGYDLDFGVEA